MAAFPTQILDPAKFTNGTRHEQAITDAERHQDVGAAAGTGHTRLGRGDKTRRIGEMVWSAGHAATNARSAAATAPPNALRSRDFPLTSSGSVSGLHPRHLHGSSEPNRLRCATFAPIDPEGPDRPDRSDGCHRAGRTADTDRVAIR